MREEHDYQLYQMLDSYKVADADDALFDKIMTKVQPSNVVAIITPPVQRAPWFKKAASFAAIAIIGFCYGNATIEETAYTEADQIQAGAVDPDGVVLGAKTFNEVTL